MPGSVAHDLSGLLLVTDGGDGCDGRVAGGDPEDAI